jgi:hypothetical protein
VDGKEITSGSIDAVPFVWRAVGSTAAKAPYNGDGRTAALFGYQPIQNVEPTDWNGEFLTASGSYTDAAHPMAAATPADPSLTDFMSAYPPKWNGLLQLRIFVGVPKEPTNTASYNSATIQVTGKTWKLVQGGGGDCSWGTSVSVESQLLPSVAALPTPGRAGSGTPAASGSTPANGTGSATAAGDGSGSASGANNATTDPTPVLAAAQHKSGGVSALLITALVVVFTAVAGAGGLIWRRRRGADIT